MRQRFFTARELRISILMIVLPSFFAAIAFVYLIKIFGGVLSEYSGVTFVLVMAGYAAVVIVLTMFFAHRFVGPFHRLGIEMNIVLGGDLRRRLSVRKHDDVFVRSFVEQVNSLIESVDGAKRDNVRLLDEVKGDLALAINGLDENNPHQSVHKKTLTELHRKIKQRIG